MKPCAMLCLTLGLLMAADAPKAKTDRDKFQGDWKVVAVVENGKEAEKLRFEKMRIRFMADKMIVREGEEKHQSAFKLDPSKKPPTIELIPDDGPKKGRKLSGIYQLDGDSLKIGMTLEAEKAAPADFTAKADSGRALLALERIKP